MAEPITVPIVFDPDELAQIGYDFMRANIPGWDPARGDPDAQTIAACAQIIAEGAGPASDVPLAIDRYEGRWIDGLPPIDATQAQTTATVTALDALGYTIADGTRFEVKTSGDEGVVFFTVGTVTIPPLSTSTAAGEVVLVAETPSAAGSGLPTLSEVVPVDSLAWVDTVTLEQVTTGGVDAETDDQYHARWVILRALSNDTPILAKDAAALIQALIPGIGRTLSLDNYDPVAGTFGNEKYVTVAAVDDAGEPLAGGIITAAVALVEARREINYVMNVIGANYATMGCLAPFVTYPGFDVASVEDAVEAALAAYFDPAVFSTPPRADATSWLRVAAVYLNDVIALVDQVEGVDRVTSLLLGKAALVTGLASTDVLTVTAHGYVLNDPVVLTGTVGGAPLVAGTTYYARDITTNTFKLSATVGGAALNITTDISAGTATGFRAADVPLTGPAPLTRPGVLQATGTAP
jgi:hypothetical protein